MRYVLAWRNAKMAAPAFWYYEYDPKARTMTFVPEGSGQTLDEFLRGMADFVQNDSLVYFRPVKED